MATVLEFLATLWIIGIFCWAMRMRDRQQHYFEAQLESSLTDNPDASLTYCRARQLLARDCCGLKIANPRHWLRTWNRDYIARVWAEADGPEQPGMYAAHAARAERERQDF